MKQKIIRRETGTGWRALLEADAGDSSRELHPVLAKVYAARGIDDPADLDLSLRHLLSYHGMYGIAEAACLLADAIEAQANVLVIGDFDADGATGCAVAVRGLRLLGAAHADFLVPNRFEFGYGLTPEIVAVAAGCEPDLIVTVDNGITSAEGVDHANALGIPVLITDHHLPGEQIPDAAAVVNPNLPECGFASKALSGVGVMFYVLSAVRAELRARGHFSQDRPAPNLAQLLDLVAVGTVADVVPLDRNNRILVTEGLRRIRSEQCRPGILALLDVAKRDRSQLVATDLGFAVGPRLNAAGRLEDMSVGVACLMSDDYRQARELAEQLDELNHQRRAIESDMRAEAMAQVESLTQLADKDPPSALCLFEEHWHPGVIGIVAGRIKDRYHRPTIAFAPDGDSALRGSARSISGVHVRDLLAAVDALNPGIIERFGGHAMAAGLTLRRDKLDIFDRAFREVVADTVPAELLAGVLLSDGALDDRELELGLARALRDGGPWGAAFPEPLFDGEFTVLEQRVVGETHLKLALAPSSVDPARGVAIPAIAFNALESIGSATLTRVRLTYKLVVNAWRGRESAELMVEQIEALE